MTNVVIHPRAAPAGSVRIWLGVFGINAAPSNVAWTLNGNPASAVSIRPLAPVHHHGAQSFTGIFELPTSGTHNLPVRISAQVAGGGKEEVVVRPFPNEIPSNDWLRILLTSCYHQAEDRDSLAARTYRRIAAAERPDLNILMGDQVYLDLPTFRNFPDSEELLAVKFEEDYRKNWGSGSGLSDILGGAPSVCCPDDHEYWNNFPHRSPIIQNSWKESSRKRWTSAANTAFEAFQGSAQTQPGAGIEIDIDSLSIMVLDQRSQRRNDRSSAMTAEALTQLETWVDRLIASKKFGAVVTGQSLLDEPVGKFKGGIADWMLANYGDYETVVRALARLADAGRPVILLTGDVHWGRVTRIQKEGRTMFYEIVCSPTSLVTTLGKDQLVSVGSGIASLFGAKKKRWPRHSAADDPSMFFASQVFGKVYKTTVLHEQKGNQMASLALRRHGGSLEAQVTYYEIHKSPQNPVSVSLGLLRDGK